VLRLDLRFDDPGGILNTHTQKKQMAQKPMPLAKVNTRTLSANQKLKSSEAGSENFFKLKERTRNNEHEIRGTDRLALNEVQWAHRAVQGTTERVWLRWLLGLAVMSYDTNQKSKLDSKKRVKG
jgi:hypothetical protein